MNSYRTQLLKAWKNLQKDLNKFSKDKNINQLQESVKNLVDGAQKDLKTLVDKDINKAKQKIKGEIKFLETKLDKILNNEISKAKIFLDQQKKELSKLQMKLEKLMSTTVKAKSGSTSKKVAKKTSGANAGKGSTKKVVSKKSTAKTFPAKGTRKS